MYLISEHSSIYERDVYGTLIGIHENYLYSANSFEEELQIYRRKVIETREWEIIWSFEVSSRSCCSCSNTVSAAYGIIGDELFVAAFGLKPKDSAIRFHLSSINLITGNIINYKTNNNTIADFCYTLCNQCCLSSITSLNPQNPFEISIIPWSPEPCARLSTTTGFYADCVQTKLLLDPETNTCTYLQSAGFRITEQLPFAEHGFMIPSNIGVLDFGKVVYFRDNDLILGRVNPAETKLEIVEDSDLQKCIYAGFYRTPGGGLQCLAFEEFEYGSGQICSIYSLLIDEEKHLAKFTKVVTLPHLLLPSDPRLCRFVLDSRILIWSYHTQTFNYIYGMLSLSEAAYISASNSYSPIFQEYQKLSPKKVYKFGDRTRISKEAENFGPSQNEIKEILGLPKSFEFCIQ